MLAPAPRILLALALLSLAAGCGAPPSGNDAGSGGGLGFGGGASSLGGGSGGGGGGSAGSFTLTVSKTGNGDGVVTSSPGGINCGTDCSETYASGTTVTLSALRNTGSVFVGWTGAGCSGTGTCTVTVSSALTVSAAFAAENTLLVTRAGTGQGTVVSTPAGIDCGTDCSEVYPGGTVVSLVATPDASSTFLGWSGACSGTGPCSVTMDSAVMVTATFGSQQVSLTVVPQGTGQGTVTSMPAGLSCGATCTALYDAGTTVTLTAMPAANSTFAGWQGAGCSGTGACVVTVSAVTSVVATFALISHPISVTVTGSGSVQSAPAGIDCGLDCNESWNVGTAVVLTALPAAGAVFAGWSGGVCTGTGPCSFTVSAAANLTATFVPDSATLTVMKSGTGSGTVTSAPAGISCGADCSETYSSATTVQLTAAPAVGSVFTGWSGGGCSGTGTCTVLVSAATTVTATFTLTSHLITLARAGAGSGTVTSAPAGIDCGTDCNELWPYGTSVVLTAVPDASSVFTGWSGGGCTGTGACTLTVTAAATVMATFEPITYSLTVTRSGTGSGTVTSSPAGINCGASCVATYASGTVVTLTATQAAGSTFAGWSGACTGTGTCVVTVSSAKAVTATFTAVTYPLTVARVGTGTGTVSSSPAGINCGATCTASFNSGTVVTLTAVPAMGSSFAGWSGGCSGLGTCVVTVTAAQTVTAAFNTGSTIYRIGNTTYLGANSMHSPNYLLGEKIVVPSPVTLLQLGLLSMSSGAQVRMALYTNTGAGGLPGTLVAESPTTTMLNGTMEMTVNGGSVPLAAGTYWIVGIYNVTASIGYTNTATANTYAYISMPFANPMPASFGTAQTQTGQSYNYWMVVQ